MKLKQGQTVHIGREKFTGEIPDEKAEAAGLKRQPKPEVKKEEPKE